MPPEWSGLWTRAIRSKLVWSCAAGTPWWRTCRSWPSGSTSRAADETRPPRFNIAPTQEVLTVTRDAGDSRNAARAMRWGLIPFWAKDIKIGNRMINARAETVDTSPAFRRAFERRRCLVVADGFYEWLKVGKDRVPMRVSLRSGEPFAFAGLWETWRSPEGEPVASCTIITTTAKRSHGAGPRQDARHPARVTPKASGWTRRARPQRSSRGCWPRTQAPTWRSTRCRSSSTRPATTRRRSWRVSAEPRRGGIPIAVEEVGGRQTGCMA